jgi:uncharacterized protein with PQ loop repeat
MFIVGLAANTISSMSIIPQVHKAIKQWSVKDMSYTWILLSVVANTLWIIYGASEQKWQVCAMGIVFTLFFSLHLYIKHSSEKNPHHLKNID